MHTTSPKHLAHMRSSASSARVAGAQQQRLAASPGHACCSHPCCSHGMSRPAARMRCHAIPKPQAAAAPATPPPCALRTMFSPPWACISGCGACCYLAPQERDLEPLSPEDRELYIGMAGPDGWCRHYDKAKHLCQVYDDRPSFCRIEHLQKMYAVPDDEMGDFAADSCRDHIEGLHGEGSETGRRFEAAQSAARTEAGWEEVGEDDEAQSIADALESMSVAEMLDVRRQVLNDLKQSPKDKDIAEALAQLDAALRAAGHKFKQGK